ncbi:Pyridoxal-5'-phosphate-dependent protein beta subunit [Emticicia oligotrophica DSM 17448]|uniref:Pyridoxal-5'-phosphate-dependent protein beta subunit n=1 Tax=Emticicia oligotrophica (strain DSM 17448 / CIP 109782 / MTCC 6937 / GPTSA100-15) TaxID=929562 RepID=A0ABM5N729_EMTOG|nr:pyridoxal-phosphate dependent enzyme [Emticicia oligotrophica]AFK05283.1 Pyridoxal-5'-phosphate-dependent protein beta subunit [Emticicia oligotrophica DSM 17448]
MTDNTANIEFEDKIKRILLLPSPLHKFENEVYAKLNLEVFIKRDDLIHKEISGNKWRKLKYNLIEAKKNEINEIITFGGAYSNHIYATAAVGKYFGFETIAIIRGDELNENSSETLKFASKCGMKLKFISRTEYRNIRIDKTPIQTNLNSLVIPEGGTTVFSLEGVGEMVEEINGQLNQSPDYIICPVGTAGTIAGIIANTHSSTKVIGICVLKKGQYLETEIENLLNQSKKETNLNYEIFWDFHHGGYAKKSPELTTFVSNFNSNQEFEIEPIYSGKLFYAFEQLVNQNYFKPNTKIVLIHTGGLRY